MTEILPGVLAHTKKQLVDQLKRITWAKRIHLDFMDGKFVPTKTVSVKTIKEHLPRSQIQVHVMAQRPGQYVESFAKLGVKEFIFHCEATRSPQKLIERVHDAGMRAGVAINPRTNVATHKKAFIDADFALIMTVQPGYSGHAFLPKALDKIKEIKRLNPAITVVIDGGIHANTCRVAAQAGAHELVATSSVTKAPQPKQAYLFLKKNCRKNN